MHRGPIQNIICNTQWRAHFGAVDRILDGNINSIFNGKYKMRVFIRKPLFIILKKLILIIFMP